VAEHVHDDAAVVRGAGSRAVKSQVKTHVRGSTRPHY
jgi:hypothetical protein